MSGILSQNIAGVNQLIGAEHPYAYELWKKGCANNWMPTDINMSKDAFQWREPGFISEDEKFLVKRCLGFFAGTESLVSNNIAINIAKYITDGACRQYIARQGFEESLHNATVEVCCSTYGLNQSEVAEAYKNIPSIKAKDDFLMQITSDIGRPGFTTDTLEGKQEFLRNLITYYIICEGIFFFSGFAMILALGHQNKLPGLSDQIRYTLRDETLHIEFGTYLINTIRRQYPEVWTAEFEAEIISNFQKAVQLEIAYAQDSLPHGILGLNSSMFIDYMMYIGNRRCGGIGISFRFPSDKNPFSWMTEQVDISAQTNFFERRVKDYQTSASLKDDF